MLRLALLLIVVVGLVAACAESPTDPSGSPTAAPTPSATATPIGFSALGLLQRSTDVMNGVLSLRATIAARTVSPDESAAWAMEIETAEDGTTRVVMRVTSPDEQRQFELIETSTHVYMKEGNAGWLRASAETAHVPSSTVDPNLFQGMFDGGDVPWEFVIVEALGMEDVRGVQAEHLRIQVDFTAMMQAQIQQLQEEMGGQEAAMSELFEGLFSLLPAIDLEMWVDGQGYVRKQRMQTTMGTEMAVTMDAEIFDFNEEIVIELPTDYVESDVPLSIPDPLG